MAAGTDADFATCGRLLGEAPEPADADLLIRGMDKALEGRRLKTVPGPLLSPLVKLWNKGEPSIALVRLAVRLGNAQAGQRAAEMLEDRKTAGPGRLALVEVLGQVANPDSVTALLKLLAPSEPKAIRLAALSALQPFPDPLVTDTVLSLYAQMPADLRGRAQTLLCARPASTHAFLLLVDGGKIDPKDVPFDQVRRVLLHNDDTVNRLVEKHWGKVTAETAGDKRARIASIKHILNQGFGDPSKGKVLFQQKCATCHTLFGEGSNIGPDLTGADRKDRDFLVTSI